MTVCMCVHVCVCGERDPACSSEEGVDLNQLQNHSRPSSVYHLVDTVIKVTPGSTGEIHFHQFE